MTRKDRYTRWLSQPEYLKTWLVGIQEAQYHHVILESEHFAIVQQDGHSWYQNAFCGMTYAPVSYTLISKTTRNYWYNRGIAIPLKGRLNKNKIEDLKKLLQEKETEKHKLGL